MFFVGCGEATVCPLSNSDSAFCDRCDYDKKSKRCGSVAGYYGDNVLPPLPDPTDNCVVNEDVLYTGMEFTFKGWFFINCVLKCIKHDYLLI